MLMPLLSCCQTRAEQSSIGILVVSTCQCAVMTHYHVSPIEWLSVKQHMELFMHFFMFWHKSHLGWLVQGDTIPYRYDLFWKGKWCPAHSSDGTLKCCSCSRLKPRGQEWVTELDGRTVCLDCLSSMVRDTRDAQPLYDQVGPTRTPKY